MTRIHKWFVPLALITLGCGVEPQSRSDMSYVDGDGPPVAVASRSSDARVDSRSSIGADSWVESGYATYHHNAEYGFSILLPRGWGPIAADALQEQSEAISGPDRKISYVAGYQVTDNDLFLHPLVLVRRVPTSAMPKHSIQSIRRLYAKSGDELAQRAESEVGLADSDYELDLKLGVPALEEETGIVWLKAQLNSVDGDRVEALVANYYVGDHILQFNAGTTTDRGEVDWPVLEQMLRAIKIDGSHDR